MCDELRGEVCWREARSWTVEKRKPDREGIEVEAVQGLKMGALHRNKFFL